MDKQTGILCGRWMLGLMGIFGLWHFARFRMGKDKAQHLLFYRGDRWARGQSYVGLFIGLGFLIIAFLPNVIAVLPGQLTWLLFIGLFVTAVVVALWQPEWLKPDWWRWLEQNHADIIPLLRKDVIHDRRTELRQWSRWVSTQEGLEAWIEEVRRKHGL